MNMRTITKGLIIGLAAGAISYMIFMPKMRLYDGPLYMDRTNLHSLAVAFQFYTNENDGRFPNFGKSAAENFDALALKEYIQWEHLKDLKRDYFYIPGLDVNDPPQTVIAGEKEAKHSYGISFITIDGKLWPAKVPKRLSYYQEEQRKALYISTGVGFLAALLYFIYKKNKL
jgi:hypothetical protein